MRPERYAIEILGSREGAEFPDPAQWLKELREIIPDIRIIYDPFRPITDPINVYSPEDKTYYLPKPYVGISLKRQKQRLLLLQKYGPAEFHISATENSDLPEIQSLISSIDFQSTQTMEDLQLLLSELLHDHPLLTVTGIKPVTYTSQGELTKLPENRPQFYWPSLLAAAYRQGLIPFYGDFDWAFTWNWSSPPVFYFFNRSTVQSLLNDEVTMVHLKKFGFNPGDTYSQFKDQFDTNLQRSFPNSQDHTWTGILHGYPVADVLAHEVLMNARSIEEFQRYLVTANQNLVYFDPNQTEGFSMGGYSEFSGGDSKHRQFLQSGTQSAIALYLREEATGATPLQIFNRILMKFASTCSDNLTKKSQ